MRRIGILGGTFDPVHDAHLAMARAAASHLRLDQVLFIPTGAPKYRRPATASGEHRVAMLRLALEGEPRFAIDERELGPQATGYTADTLAALKREHPGDELFLLMGADQYARLPTWERPGEVARLAHIAVVARPGVPLEGTAALVPMDPLDISATRIRERARQGLPLGDVPSAVANYISHNRLYS